MSFATTPTTYSMFVANFSGLLLQAIDSRRDRHLELQRTEELLKQYLLLKLPLVIDLL